MKNGKPKFPVAEKSRRTVDNIVFDSRGEADRYGVLKLSQRAGLIANLELQPEFRVEINGKPYCRYRADFSYLTVPDGVRVIEDTKSSGTSKDPAYRLRKKAAELAHGIKITEVIPK